jgi:hypothetical protein
MPNRTDIDAAGQVGFIADIDDTQLPQNAWSDTRNVRFYNGRANKMLGDKAVFEGSASVMGNPLALFPVQTETSYLWVYPSDTRIYATDGDTHADISESATLSLTYTTNDDLRWNGGVLNGYAILNNGSDIPVYWNPSLSNDVAKLDYDQSAGTTWADITAAPRCNVMRVFKEFAVAMDITENAVRNKRLLWWSHPASAVSMPKTWDYTKTNYFAAQVELAETQGILIDALTLKNDMAIYKDDSIYRMTYTGLPNIFTFRKEIETLGALSRDCVVTIFGSHLVFGNGDVILHNFSETKSVLTRKTRRWLYNQISSTRYERSFVLLNQDRSEVWICFPETGSDYPSLALIWNWEHDTCTVRELNNIVCGSVGIIDPGSEATTFDGQTGTFDTDFGAFGESSFNPSATRLALGQRSAATSPKILLADSTEQFSGVDMTAYLERSALPLGRQMQDGTARVDLGRIKQVTRIIPRIRATAGATMQIMVGTQDHPNGAISWRHTGTFTPETDWKHDCRVSGRLIAVRFTSTTNISWSMEGFSLEWSLRGDR